ncbi:ankyrin repeat domain-containing protein [Thiomonas sp.]|uniref:ankyrin repeat domain-containing protein n=1 Tax=Thiomonas sp. TaxID=2047785 RepID=UPI0039B9AB63
MMNHLRRRFLRSATAATLLAASVAASGKWAFAGAYTDFFRAVNIDDAGAVRSLLAQGFDPNAVDSHGNSALYLALRYNSLKVARVLIDDPHIHLDQLNPSGENALMIASLQGDLDIVKLMVDKGAEVNKPGWTPLSYAATRGHTEIVKYLLEHSAYIDAAAPNGSTPLMMAAYFGYDGTVKLLLEEGADPKLKNAMGFTALTLATKMGHQDIADMIAKALGKDRPQGSW